MFCNTIGTINTLMLTFAVLNAQLVLCEVQQFYFDSLSSLSLIYLLSSVTFCEPIFLII